MAVILVGPKTYTSQATSTRLTVDSHLRSRNIGYVH